MSPSIKITAVVPTNGRVPMGELAEALQSYVEIEEIIFIRGDAQFNRYRAARRAKSHFIYTQDDFCITDLRPLINAFELGVVTIALTPELDELYSGRPTPLKLGAIFERRMLDCFEGWEHDQLFMRQADVVFAASQSTRVLYPEIRFLGNAEGRMVIDTEYWAMEDRVFAHGPRGEQNDMEITI